MADDPKRVPDYGLGEPANTQEWIRRAFGDRPRMTDEERADAKDAQRERKRERQFMHSGAGRRAWRNAMHNQAMKAFRRD